MSQNKNLRCVYNNEMHIYIYILNCFFLWSVFCGHLDVIKRKILYFGSSLQSTIIVLFQNFSNPRKHTKTYKVMDFTSSKTSSQSTEKAFVISKSLLKFVYLTQNLLKYSKSSFLPKKKPKPNNQRTSGREKTILKNLRPI